MRIDELFCSDGTTGNRYETLKRRTPLYRITCDCKSGIWDFSELDTLTKERAVRWITDCRKLRQHEQANGLKPWYVIMVNHIVYKKEDIPAEPEWPERLRKYQVSNIAEAYLIDTHELY